MGVMLRNNILKTIDTQIGPAPHLIGMFDILDKEWKGRVLVKGAKLY